MKRIVNTTLLLILMACLAQSAKGQPSSAQTNVDESLLKSAFDSFVEMPVDPFGRTSKLRNKRFRQQYPEVRDIGEDTLFQWSLKYVETALRANYGQRTESAKTENYTELKEHWLRLTSEDKLMRRQFADAIGEEYFPEISDSQDSDVVLNSLRNVSSPCQELMEAYAKALLRGGDRTRQDELVAFAVEHLGRCPDENCRSEIIQLTIASPQHDLMSKFIAAICGAGESPLARAILDGLFHDSSSRQYGLASDQLIALIRCMPDSDVARSKHKWSSVVRNQHQLIKLLQSKDLSGAKRAAIATGFEFDRGLTQFALTSKDPALLDAYLRKALQPGLRPFPSERDLESLLLDNRTTEIQKQLIVAIFAQRSKSGGNIKSWRDRLESLAQSDDELIARAAQTQLINVVEYLKRMELCRIRDVSESEDETTKQLNQLHFTIRRLMAKPESERSNSDRDVIMFSNMGIWAFEPKLVNATVARMYLDYSQSESDLTWPEYLINQADQLEERSCKLYVLDTDQIVEIGESGPLFGVAACDSSANWMETPGNEPELNFVSDFLCLLSHNGKATTIDYYSFRRAWMEYMQKREADGLERIKLAQEIETKMSAAILPVE